MLGIISGTIPERDSQGILSAIPVEKLLGNQLLVDAFQERLQGQGTGLGRLDTDYDDRARQSLFITQTSGMGQKRKKSRQIWMAKRTFLVSCRNGAGIARCRVTFQIVPHPREPTSSGASASATTPGKKATSFE